MLRAKANPQGQATGLGSSQEASQTPVPSTPQISGVLKDYLATKQAALARQAGGQQPQPSSPEAIQGTSAGSTMSTSNSPATGVLKDYLATIRARQAGQSQSPQQNEALTLATPTGMELASLVTPHTSTASQSLPDQMQVFAELETFKNHMAKRRSMSLFHLVARLKSEAPGTSLMTGFKEALA